jgi:hypothetical protein
MGMSTVKRRDNKHREPRIAFNTIKYAPVLGQAPEMTFAFSSYSKDSVVSPDIDWR